MGTPETFEFNRQRKRPLELRVRDLRDEGGISEEDAERHGRVAADAFVIVRFMADPGAGMSLGVHSINGNTLEELSADAQFSAWISYTAFLARHEGVMAPQRRFLQNVLRFLKLTEDLQVIPDAAPPASRCEQEGEAPSSSG